ncbi:hypothetical protein BDV12DRAFT_181122 [Aspergillus spectabilis]
MAPPELPAWARIILIVFTTLSFLPQLHKLIASSDSSSISPYYVLSNLLLATNHFTIYLAFCVSDPSGGGVVVHNPPSTADFLNLTQVFVVWLLFSLVFVLTLTYLPSDDRPAKRNVVSIYIAFLLISLIPQVYDIIAGFNGLAHSDREWLLVFFVAGHLAIVNPVLTIFAIVSARIQVRKIKRGTAVTGFSTPGLATQIITFAVVAVSWIWRVLYGDAPRFVDNAALDWYAKFGWPVVGNTVFANVHFMILWVIARRGRGGTDSVQGSEGETEPLLS